MTIPILDLQAQYRTLRSAIETAVREVLEGGQFVLGANVRALEQELAGYMKVTRAIGLASGTDALHLALRACGVGSGAGVLTSPFTFVATATAISYVGGEPRFADVSPDTFTLDPDRVAEVLAGGGPGGRSPGRLRALIPVHLYGQAAEMEPLRSVAERHGLRVIEDAAQAIGAEYRGKRVGGLGDVGCFSFYPTKNLGAFGDAGMATTNDEELGARIAHLRVYASRGRYVHDDLGYNSRLDEIQAAILRVKLRWLDRWTARRREIAARYRAGLAGLGVGLPVERPDRLHVYHQFVIRVADRDGVQQRMSARGVRTAVYYPLPLHLQPMYRELGYREGDFPEAERASREVLCLPMYPELTDGQVDEVMAAVKACV